VSDELHGLVAERPLGEAGGEASFVETRTRASNGEVKTRTGRVIFERPGKLSWRFEDDVSRVVSDGAQVVALDARRREVRISQPAQNAHASALAFLWERGSLGKEFRLRTLQARKLGYGSGHVLECTPLTRKPAFRKLLLHVGEQGQVRRVLVIDSEGNRIRFDFSEIQINAGRPALEFFIVPPNGTRILSR
jgi:outer membrane lipoprotein carrier protein